MDIERKRLERLHGRSIVGCTERIWGYKSLAGRTRIERRARLLQEAMELSSKPKVISPLKVLELGCGPGEYTKRLLPPGVRFIGLDICIEFLEIHPCNKKKTSGNGEMVYLINGDAEEMPFKGGHFHAVIGNAVLHHLRINEVLKEIRRILTSGGIMTFTEPNLLNPQVFLQRKVKRLRDKAHVSPFETAFLRGSMVRTLKDRGFTDITVRYVDFIHPRIPDILARPFLGLSPLLEKTPLINKLAGSLFIRAKSP